MLCFASVSNYDDSPRNGGKFKHYPILSFRAIQLVIKQKEKRLMFVIGIAINFSLDLLRALFIILVSFETLQQNECLDINFPGSINPGLIVGPIYSNSSFRFCRNFEYFHEFFFLELDEDFSRSWNQIHEFFKV